MGSESVGRSSGSPAGAVTVSADIGCRLPARAGAREAPPPACRASARASANPVTALRSPATTVPPARTASRADLRRVGGGSALRVLLRRARLSARHGAAKAKDGHDGPRTRRRRGRGPGRLSPASFRPHGARRGWHLVLARGRLRRRRPPRSEAHTSELPSRRYLV